jgi:hypothetical protein
MLEPAFTAIIRVSLKPRQGGVRLLFDGTDPVTSGRTTAGSIEKQKEQREDGDLQETDKAVEHLRRG